MIVQKETIQKEFSRDMYWTRVYFESEISSKKNTLLLCVSHEYLWDKLGIRDLTNQNVENWVDGVIEDWIAQGESIFDQTTHLKVYATSEEGEKNGLEFLRTEVTV